METFEDEFEICENVNINLDEILNEDVTDDVQNSQVNQANCEGNTMIGDGLGTTPKENSVIETQASTSKSKTTARRRRNGQTRSTIPRSSKLKAKHMIKDIARGIIPKDVSQSRKSIRSSFKRKAARSDATLRKRLTRARSSDSLISNRCPRCGHSCCNWYLN
ncbi:uncharacterized protein LOC126775045 [Nymphalis io]|uniref:uncharacterized protein LOC126775045 n=1 Tax=Inachis io TaxID=171585 RepID=UPI002168C71C|nr:uncharacterized protein LOC126775045 [Nymphalis io]